MFALDSLFTCNKEQILTDAPPPHLLYHLQETGFPSNSPISSPRDRQIEIETEREKKRETGREKKIDREIETGEQLMKLDHLGGRGLSTGCLLCASHFIYTLSH